MEINEITTKKNLEKINEQSWFFENKQNQQTFSQTNQEKRERTQIDKIRNERREGTADNSEIQRIIRDYYEQLYTNKLDKLEETDIFLETYNLSRLNHEERENLNRLITSKGIETVIKNLPTATTTKPRTIWLHW